MTNIWKKFPTPNYANTNEEWRELLTTQAHKVTITEAIYIKTCRFNPIGTNWAEWGTVTDNPWETIPIERCSLHHARNAGCWRLPSIPKPSALEKDMDSEVLGWRLQSRRADMKGDPGAQLTQEPTCIEGNTGNLVWSTTIDAWSDAKLDQYKGCCPKFCE